MSLRAVIMETSGTEGELAFADEGGLRSVIALSGTRRHARDLVPLMKRSWEALGWRGRDINLVVVDIGPGSYTGLRVGVMAAKMLAFVNNVPIIGIDSMSVVAEMLPDTLEPIHVLVDAQQGRVYSGILQRDGVRECVKFSDSIRIESFQEWLSHFTGGVVTGPALDRFAEAIPKSISLAPPEMRKPRAATLWQLGRKRFADGNQSDVWKIEPLYLRPSAAEEKWDVLHPSTVQRSPTERQ